MKSANRNLPARMRAKTTSSGKVYYYYDTCAKPRKWLALGSDFFEALRKYADYEQEYCEQQIHGRLNAALTFRYVANRYKREVLPKKSPATQADNLRELEKLLEFFDDPPAPINEIEPVNIREYLDWRSQTAKVRANREIALFSHIFNKAREWGYTSKENPCRGVSRNKESGRDVYVHDDVFWQVYGVAERHIQFIMLVAYLTGQRVADCLKIKTGDIRDGELYVRQNKVKTRLRIRITGLLEEVITQLLQERGEQRHDRLFVYMGGRHAYLGQPLTTSMLRGGMDRAREKAGIDKAAFQFRDLRAKAATDKDESISLEAASRLLGHSSQTMTMHYIRNRKGKLVDPTK